MSLIHWNGGTPTTNFNRLFDNFISRTQDENWQSCHYCPSVDIKETEDAFAISAELPGLDKEDVNVSVEEGVLTISGERKLERDEEKDNFHLVERSYGKFIRRFSLGDKVDHESIAAGMDKGILKITLKKAAKILPKQIEVQVK